MKIIFDIAISIIALTTPLWTIYLVSRVIEWHEKRKETILKVHRNSDGSLKYFEFKNENRK